MPAPEREARAFFDAHPDLYTQRNGRLGLDVSRGLLPTRSLLEAPGFARAAEPDWNSLTPIAPAAVPEPIPHGTLA